MGRQARIVIFLFVVLVWIAGCVPQPKALQEPATTATATPDPLYSLHCVRHQKANDLCYAGEGLIGNNELLEKAAFDYCQNVAWIVKYACLIYIWKDESSVAQSIPLSDADKASQLAAFNRNPVTLKDCFKVYDQGEVIYQSDGCANWNR